MKTGNNNSPLLTQLIEAAESTKPKAKTNFAEDIFKAAHTKTASVHEIITAALSKRAQVDPVGGLAESPPMGKPATGEINDLDRTAEPPVNELGGSEEAKTKIAEALVSLCDGDVEAACDFIRSCCGVETEELAGPMDVSPGEETETPLATESSSPMEAPPSPMMLVQ